MKITPVRRTVALVATLALAVGVLAGTATTASAAGPSGIVSGSITQPGGALVAGADIYFFGQPVGDDDGNRLVEAEDGTFSIAVPAGTYRVEIDDPCNVYADVDTTLTVAANSDVTLNAAFTTTSTTAPTFVCDRVSPKVAGLPQVGVPLVVSAPTFAQPGVGVSYQWVRGNYSTKEDIPGATGATYVPTASDVGNNVYVRVQGVLAGFTTYSRNVVPASSDVVKRGDHVFKTGPKVNGLPIVGRTIAASPGALVPGATVSYQWFRNGVALPGKTARTYRVARADYKKKITAVVTYKTLGYSTVVRTVAPAFVPKNKGKISARTSVSKRTATIKVAVSPKASRKSQGKIIVLEDGKTLKRSSIKAGTTTVKVTGLKKGKHKLTIVFDGKRNLAGTSKTVRIKK